jgi:hypothetical protein
MSLSWTDVVIAVISGTVTAFCAIIANNKKMAVFQAVMETKLDFVISNQKKQDERLDQHNHLDERVTRLEVLYEERSKPA